MRTGRIRTRRERARARRRTIAALLLLAGALCAGAAAYIRTHGLALPAAYTRAAQSAPPESREHTLATESWYALQAGMFESADGAEALAKTLAASGLACHIMADVEGYRVLTACRPSRAQARTAQAQALEAHGVKTVVHALPGARIVLRMTGASREVSALSAALQYLESAPARLYALLSADDAQKTAALASERGTCRVLARALAEAFPHDTPAHAHALSDILLAVAQTESPDALGNPGIITEQCLLLCAAETHALALSFAQ